jgi:hypothetical protein
MPAIVMAALANDLNPAIDTQRRLIARWSCSMRLLRYLLVRTFTFRQQRCSRRSGHRARRLGTCPSSVTLRGTRGSVEASALRKKACAVAVAVAVASKQEVDRLALLVDRAIKVAPFGFDRDVENRLQRFSNSGTYRVTQRRIVLWATLRATRATERRFFPRRVRQ